VHLDEAGSARFFFPFAGAVNNLQSRMFEIKNTGLT
jgi:hypothetical protein